MSETTPYRYLRPADVIRLGSYEFAAKTMVEGYLSGRHRSRQRGSSIEFLEYRQYVPGDDPALVDWRVFARTERHYLKTFEQETNLECHLFVDSSASMGFQGSAELTKLEFASFFAACLSWLVIAKNDRVSLQLFDQGIRQSFSPGSTREHLHKLLRALEENYAGESTEMSEVMRRAEPLIKRKGTLVVLSDFYDDPVRIFSALNAYLHRGFRVILFHLLDPAELDLAAEGLARYEDLESSQRITLHSDSLKAAYRKRVEDHLRTMRRLAASRMVEYAQVSTEDSYFALLDLITHRRAR